ncbi:hypothetical protein Rin_00005450 [Candidatus Regiella insecticola 5.15]|uniref:Uncharacterized protein n=1 Tax=Candidatus Regiella insecticola 5.15 TaxID=1005043 RepID=G2GXQ3_9ENTR|nr:hypothetical protein Rin_00005450 [Candidatus Regiella insecticola 5.15]
MVDKNNEQKVDGHILRFRLAAPVDISCLAKLSVL